MKHTILIPVDGTESIEETLTYVRSITPKEDTKVVILHVTQNVDSLNAAVDVHPNFNEIHDVLKSEGWDVTREERMGDPVREITKMAILLPATMMFMSTHGRSGLERIREGSVTEQVLKQSPCPIFILHSALKESQGKEKEHLFKRILVPLDGTDTSAAILECVERFASMHDSEVVLFHDEIETAESEEERTAIKNRLQEHSVALANSGVRVSLDMSTYKRPIREILNTIDEMGIDLVSMCCHGEGGKRRSMDESVTAEVIRHASCPLLVWSSEPQCPILT